jgi:hypothetical protein
MRLFRLSFGECRTRKPTLATLSALVQFGRRSAMRATLKECDARNFHGNCKTQGVGSG